MLQAQLTEARQLLAAAALASQRESLFNTVRPAACADSLPELGQPEADQLDACAMWHGLIS